MDSRLADETTKDKSPIVAQKTDRDLQTTGY